MDVSMSPIKRTSISKMIQRQIIDLIREGAFQPGEKLPSERELCESFLVSRTSLREAVGGLEATGVLCKKGDGIYVRENLDSILSKPLNLLIKLQNVSLEEIFEARIVTESQIIALATIKATPEDIRKLESIVELTDNATSDEVRHIQAANFHRTLAEITRNPILISMFSVLYDIITDQRRGGFESTSSFHRELLGYIKRKDSHGAAAAMHEHIDAIREYLHEEE